MKASIMRSYRVRRWMGMRRGRPPALGAEAVALLQTLMAHTPLDYDSSAHIWTVPLLLYILEEHGYPLCDRTLRKRLHDLGYHWDQPVWRVDASVVDSPAFTTSV